MKYGLISSQEIIAKTIRDFGLEVENKYDCIEWIGDGIQEIGYHVGFVNKIKKVRIKDFKIEIPCDFFSLSYFFHHHQKLSYGKNNNSYNNIHYHGNTVRHNNHHDRIEDSAATLVLKHICDEVDKCGNTLDVQPKDIIYIDNTCKHSVCHLDYYYLNDNCGGYTTNITDDYCYMFYKAFPLDKDGFPMVVNEIMYKKALSHIILLRALATGWKSMIPEMNYMLAHKLSEKFVNQASNHHLKFSEQEFESFTSNWTDMSFRLKNDYSNNHNHSHNHY